MKYMLKNYARVGVLLLLVVGAYQQRKMHTIGKTDSLIINAVISRFNLVITSDGLSKDTRLAILSSIQGRHHIKLFISVLGSIYVPPPINVEELYNPNFMGYLLTSSTIRIG